MQCIKHKILSVIIISALILSGVPVFNPDDASRDNRVDLEDAVLRVRDFARTAECPDAFASGVEKAISALNAVAGLKTVIRPVDDSKNGAKSVSAEFCLISSYSVLPLQDRGVQVYEGLFFYKSLMVSPAHRYG